MLPNKRNYKNSFFEYFKSVKEGDQNKNFMTELRIFNQIIAFSNLGHHKL